MTMVIVDGKKILRLKICWRIVIRTSETGLIGKQQEYDWVYDKSTKFEDVEFE